MIYMKSADGSTKVIVLEAANLELIRQGKPLRTADGSVMIAYTPDLVWLADKLMDCDGDAATIARLIDEAAKRPQRDPGVAPFECALL
jgi:hypothetical protein